MTEILEIKDGVEQATWRTVDQDHIEIQHPQHQKSVTIKTKKVTHIRAQVSERWVANVCIPVHLCRHIVEAPFLEPILVNGHAVLSLCAIFIKHAAPPWVPLAWGPSSHNCALRIACIDKRDGSQAVWVDYRYTDSQFAAIIAFMGFPPLLPFLQIRRWQDEEQETLSLSATNGALCLALESGHQKQTPFLFKSAEDFSTYFCAGIRSYGPGPDADKFCVVDLEKDENLCFEGLETWRGILETEMGRWICDGIYRTTNQIYDWKFYGYCDKAGQVI